MFNCLLYNPTWLSTSLSDRRLLKQSSWSYLSPTTENLLFPVFPFTDWQLHSFSFSGQKLHHHWPFLLSEFLSDASVNNATSIFKIYLTLSHYFHCYYSSPSRISWADYSNSLLSGLSASILLPSLSCFQYRNQSDLVKPLSQIMSLID